MTNAPTTSAIDGEDQEDAGDERQRLGDVALRLLGDLGAGQHLDVVARQRALQRGDHARPPTRRRRPATTMSLEAALLAHQLLGGGGGPQHEAGAGRAVGGPKRADADQRRTRPTPSCVGTGTGVAELVAGRVRARLVDHDLVVGSGARPSDDAEGVELGRVGPVAAERRRRPWPGRRPVRRPCRRSGRSPGCRPRPAATPSASRTLSSRSSETWRVRRRPRRRPKPSARSRSRCGRRRRCPRRRRRRGRRTSVRWCRSAPACRP